MAHQTLVLALISIALIGFAYAASPLTAPPNASPLAAPRSSKSGACPDPSPSSSPTGGHHASGSNSPGFDGSPADAPSSMGTNLRAGSAGAIAISGYLCFYV